MSSKTHKIDKIDVLYDYYWYRWVRLNVAQMQAGERKCGLSYYLLFYDIFTNLMCKEACNGIYCR
jgi:hypothetical protein